MAEVPAADHTQVPAPEAEPAQLQQNQPEPVAISTETGHSTDHEDRDALNCPTFNIYVADLPPDATDDDLLDAFKGCGPIHSAQVVKDKLTGQSRRYGFVNFQTEEARETAIANAKALVVKGSTPRAFKSDSKNTLFIGNLPINTGSADLRVFLEKEGGVEIQSLILKPGYCFVTYPNFRQAERAAAALKGRTLNGAVIKVQLAMSKEKKGMLGDTEPPAPMDNMPRTLYIRNISDAVTEEGLRNVFTPFGTVVKCSLVRNFNYGFVEFASHTEAAAAIEGTNTLDLEGKKLIVEYARAPSGQRGRRSERGGGGGPPYPAYRGPPGRGSRYDDGYGRDRYYDHRSYSPPGYHEPRGGRGRPPPREYDRYGPYAPYYDDRYAPPPYPAWPPPPAGPHAPPAGPPPPSSVSSYLSALSAYAPTLSQLAAANATGGVPPAGPSAPPVAAHPAAYPPPPYPPAAYPHPPYPYGDEYGSARRDRPADRYAPY